MTFDESKVRRDQGKFANKDANRDEADIDLNLHDENAKCRCGRPLVVDADGIASHVDETGNEDWEANADHVPEAEVDYYTEIRSNIESGVFMSLGASEIRSSRHGLAFKARVIPFNERGQRLERPIQMDVRIIDTGYDTYRIEVTHGAKVHGVQEANKRTLNRELLAIDHFDYLPFNPRLTAHPRGSGHDEARLRLRSGMVALNPVVFNHRVGGIEANYSCIKDDGDYVYVKRDYEIIEGESGTYTVRNTNSTLDGTVTTNTSVEESASFGSFNEAFSYMNATALRKSYCDTYDDGLFDAN